jgi:putative Ca2+/H+ antiporter (TMEM165/GDT1 family)
VVRPARSRDARDLADPGRAAVGFVVLDLATVGLAFILIFPAELPDKTFIATLVLSTRYRRLAVWIGVALAFAVQSAIAVAAGGLLSLLPQRLVLGITFLLFAAGAVLMLVSGLRARSAEKAEEGNEAEEFEESAARHAGASTSTLRITITSFLVLFTAEWGDLSQLLTAGLAARTGEPFSVFLGAWVALILVAGIAVLIGGWLQKRVALWRIRLVSAAVLAALAAWTLVEFIQA